MSLRAAKLIFFLNADMAADVPPRLLKPLLLEVDKPDSLLAPSVKSVLDFFPFLLVVFFFFLIALIGLINTSYSSKYSIKSNVSSFATT